MSIIEKSYMIKEDVENYIVDSAKIISDSTALSKEVVETIEQILTCLKNGNKLIFFGNGGSAADAQHLAAEFIGRFKLERNSLPAISLTTDSSILTSLSNDYSFDIVFSRQCESLVVPGDLAFGISTSGNSKNVELGLKKSREKGAKTIALLGNDGGNIKNMVDIAIVVHSNDTAKIQEVHRVLYHIICNFVEQKLISN
jgi:D-sedoheptulose 7-phosphate isomerase